MSRPGSGSAVKTTVDADAPPIDAEVDLLLAPTSDGGLEGPLKLPTESLVFRDQDRPEGTGFTATVEHEGLTALEPGSVLCARVRFIGVPVTEVWIGRRFALWCGRDVGTGTVRQFNRDTR